MHPMFKFRGGRGRQGFQGPAELCIRGEFPHGGGGKRERMFGAGDLKVVVLHILAARAGHGYEIIKAIGDLTGGDYSPSPGTVYPTLSLLEDLGHVTVATEEGGRKRYSLTAEGQAFLEASRADADRVLQRLQQVGSRAHARRVPEIQRAMDNLKAALQLRLGGESPDPAEIRRITALIDRAAGEIERG